MNVNNVNLNSINFADTTSDMAMYPNEVYGVHSNYIKTTPNEVYGLGQVSQQYISVVAHTETEESQSSAPTYEIVNY